MIQYGRKKTEQFYMDKRLKKELDILLNFVLNSDDDIVLVIDGEEGAGKSKLARQICTYAQMQLKKGFTVKSNIHFDLNEYVDTSLESGLYWINLLDESRKILNKKRSMGKDTVRFTNYLSECRSMRQLHILVVPSFHDLDSYIVNWRMKFMIQVLKDIRPDESSPTGYKLVRGNYVIHDKHSCRSYYNNPEMRYRHPKFQKTDICQFSDHEVVDEKEYKAKKHEYTVEKYHSENIEKESLTEKDKTAFVQRDKLLYELSQFNVSAVKLAAITGLNTSRVHRILQEERERNSLTVDLRSTRIDTIEESR